ncbi:phosphate ABC transporter substrate-binding protein PstS [Pseudoglutamicibacter cumminsii]|uniref:phosphate ABC transporter substrate-binding protein PstS n=1 Tax=Pseudoglutamicibacter cumminsii TaxID=156979 RepID=UPI00195A6CF6|nr:phosphate ABC transporter substrate-binding protein PstS [Pseudoglutamicibacter cumminsii]MBM7796017.1 phosphate transport system substrate-binding protein [Pseudoglutamicibacter cumminsii]
MTVQIKHFGRTAAILSIAALGLTACGQANNTSESSNNGSDNGDAKQVSGTLSGAGASSQESAIGAWTAGLQESQSKLNVQYNPAGSGAGRKAFLSGQASFAGSDAALKEDEVADAEKICGPEGAINIPAYISPIAIVVNLEGVDEINLDAETLAKIFAEKITKWNDPAIAALNEGVDLPDTKIIPVHRADKSGTTDNFTDYLAENAKDAWPAGNVEEWPSDLGGEAAQGTSALVGVVQKNNGAIGYADKSAAGDLTLAKIKVGENFQAPEEEAAAKSVEISERLEGKNENDMAVRINRTSTEEGTYPLVLVSYHIYCSSYKDQSTVDMIQAWGHYVVSEDGQKAANAAAGSAPMTETMRENAAKAIDSIKVAE